MGIALNEPLLLAIYLIIGVLFGESLATNEPFTSFLRQAQDKLNHYPIYCTKAGTNHT